MARETTKWPSTRWPITKIMSSDGCNGNRVPLEMGPWYDDLDVPLTATQLSDTVLAAQALQNDPDLLFGAELESPRRMSFTTFSADVVSSSIPRGLR